MFLHFAHKKNRLSILMQIDNYFLFTMSESHLETGQNPP